MLQEREAARKKQESNELQQALQQRQLAIERQLEQQRDQQQGQQQQHHQHQLPSDGPARRKAPQKSGPLLNGATHHRDNVQRIGMVS